MNLLKLNQWRLSAFIFLFLFSSNVSAGPGNVMDKIRRFFNPNGESQFRKDSDLDAFFEAFPEYSPMYVPMENVEVTEGMIIDEVAETVMMAHRPGVLDDTLDNTARREVIERFKNEFSDREILEGFGDVFRSMDKNSGSYDFYKKMIFEKWWSNDSIRPFMFDFIGKEDLSSSDYLLKWWDEAKARGGEIRLQEYTRDFTGNLQSGRFDPFGPVLMKTVRENETFAREWETIMKTPEPRRRRLEYDDDDLA